MLNLAPTVGFPDRNGYLYPALLRRQRGLSGFHGIEGAHALEGDVTRVRALSERGVAFIGVVHLTDNAFGGSSSGSDRGLTPLGRDLIEAMNEADVIVDLAHASPETFADGLELTELPSTSEP